MTATAFSASIPPRLAAAALTLLMAAGCTSLAPEYQRPALPVPQAYPRDSQPPAGQLDAAQPAAAPASIAAPAAARIAWQSYFPDPALQGLIATAHPSARL